MSTMRTALSVLSLCVSLVACDFPKSVGDDETTTGEDPSASGGATSEAESSGVTGFPGTASATTGAGSATSGPGSASATSAGVTTAAGECPPFDPGPSADPDNEYSWECWCQGCQLEFPDIPFETVQQFEEGGLCDCLCQEAGCGPVEGEGGVGGGAETIGDTDTAGGTDSWGGSTSGAATTGDIPLTYQDCLDEGGSIVGDPGDGSVFEADYLCPDGQSPLGILDFEPGMPFPKNGGVCCP